MVLWNRKMTLKDVGKLRGGGFQKLARDLGVQASGMAKFMKAAQAIPDIDVNVEGDGNGLALTVMIRRLNGITEREGRIFAPKFPKPQNEGWFVEAGEAWEVTPQEMVMVGDYRFDLDCGHDGDKMFTSPEGQKVLFQ